jgi:hypothetical protein
MPENYRVSYVQPASTFSHFGANSISRRARGLLALMATLVLVLGCGSSKEAALPDKPKPESGRLAGESQAALNEDFDPMTLKGPEFRIARKQVPQKTDTVSIAAPVVQADTSWQTVPGYQVQLLQTEDAKLAREIVKEATFALNTEVEITYEAPYYKVRAGRFTNRYNAEQLQNLASEKGYANCWVVRTLVKMRASDLLDHQ